MAYRVKSTNSFTHDANARNDEKIVRLRMRHGAAGYGVYFMIIERLREERNYMSVRDYNVIAYDLRVDANLVKSVVEDFGLFAFTEKGKCFYSESFNERMNGGNKKQRCSKSETVNHSNDTQCQKEEAPATVKSTPQITESLQSVDNTPTNSHKQNDDYLILFFDDCNKSQLELLLKNLSLKPTDIGKLRKLANQITAEWNISQQTHNSYTDFARHLINSMRLARYNSSRLIALEDETPESDDYTYNGGFGSADT